MPKLNCSKTGDAETPSFNSSDSATHQGCENSLQREFRFPSPGGAARQLTKIREHFCDRSILPPDGKFVSNPIQTVALAAPRAQSSPSIQRMSEFYPHNVFLVEFDGAQKSKRVLAIQSGSITSTFYENSATQSTAIVNHLQAVQAEQFELLHPQQRHFNPKRKDQGQCCEFEINININHKSVIPGQNQLGGLASAHHSSQCVQLKRNSKITNNILEVNNIFKKIFASADIVPSHTPVPSVSETSVSTETPAQLFSIYNSSTVQLKRAINSNFESVIASRSKKRKPEKFQGPAKPSTSFCDMQNTPRHVLLDKSITQIDSVNLDPLVFMSSCIDVIDFPLEGEFNGYILKQVSGSSLKQFFINNLLSVLLKFTSIDYASAIEQFISSTTEWRFRLGGFYVLGLERCRVQQVNMALLGSVKIMDPVTQLEKEGYDICCPFCLIWNIENDIKPIFDLMFYRELMETHCRLNHSEIYLRFGIATNIPTQFVIAEQLRVLREFKEVKKIMKESRQLR